VGHISYIVAAFAVAGIGLLWLIVTSYIGMRKSEALADDLRQRD
jgi:uncharacterized membrane protein YqiK